MDPHAHNKSTTTAVEEDWYEHGFTKIDGSRKRGVTSMPLPAAQTLLKWAGYVANNDIAGKLVIDPSCGSGNSLLAATQTLVARGKARRWGAERVAQEIEHCIWGLDPDPIACNVAEMRLRRLIAHLLPDLPAARRKTLQLHIHQTDSLSLPTDARFHIVITNPPLATARGVVVSYGGFEAKTPPKDVWLSFLEQSMQLTTWGGALAIALPEALLAKAGAATLRATLLSEWSIDYLAHLTGVFRSGPGTVMLLARRSDPAPDARMHWERIERVSVAKKTSTGVILKSGRAERRIEGTIAQSQIARDKPRAPWRYALGEAERAFIDRMANANGTITRVPLNSLVTITRGAEIVKDAPEPISTPIPGGFPIIRGVDVEPFMVHNNPAWLPSSALKGNLAALQGPKIILPRVAGSPSAAYDQNAIPSSALLTLLPLTNDPASGTTLLYILALLNAAPLRAYLALMQTAYLVARPAIDMAALGALPIVQCPEESRKRLIGLANELTRHYSAHGNAPDDVVQYPVGQRLESLIAMEVSTLYNLTPEDKAIIDRWQLH
jgi:N-6 DNA Methylase